MPDDLASIAGAIARLAAELDEAGIASAAMDARVLVLGATGLHRLDLVREPGLPLDAPGERRLDDFRRRRLAREPVSRILGHREFWSLDFEVTPDVLDPRPDTETLVDVALEIAGRAGLDRKPMQFLDLGTGSGAILVALLRELQLAFGIGIDRSLAALEVARRNARSHEVSARSAFLCGSWAEAVAGPFDLVVSNPPYLTSEEIGRAEPEVAQHDPPAALDGGVDGLNAYRTIVADWQRLGCPPIVLEVGVGQADLVIDLLKQSMPGTFGLQLECTRDLAGNERVVSALPQFRFP